MLGSIPQNHELSKEARNVIQRLSAGKSPSSKDTNWESLSLYDHEAILEAAEKLISLPEGHKQLIDLYSVCKNDHWAGCQTLGMLARSRYEKTKKEQNVLKRIRRLHLDKLRATLRAESPPDDIHRYQRFEADYYVLSGMVAEENNDRNRSIEYFLTAVERYEKLGLKNLAESAKARVELLKNQSTSLITLEELADTKTQLQILNQRIDQAKKDEEQLIQTIQSKSDEIEQINTGIQKLSKKHKEEETIVENLQQKITDMQEVVGQYQIVDEFFQALIQLSTAPLWVEAVRLSLQENQIDDHLLWAVKKLSNVYPEHALPLMAEIAARSKYPLTYLEKLSERIPDNWMTQVAQAKNLLDDSPEKAGELLIEAWDSFFQKQASEEENLG